MGMTDTTNLFSKHEKLINEAKQALSNRKFYSPYPEHPKAYAEDANQKGKADFGKLLNQNYEGLGQDADTWVGEEVSPFWQTGLGIKYPANNVNHFIKNAKVAANSWKETPVNDRAGILVESLEQVKGRFFELAYATMHTTGQSFMMSFQASGPHANDRALEAIVMGVQELSRFPQEQTWTKPMGKFDLTLQKNWKAIPKGIGLVIGCSTFPTWNTVPGLYANLIVGNPVIVKPHPKSILAIALVVDEIRNTLKSVGLDPNIVQLAPDTLSNPITKDFTEHNDIALIDYTGGNAFGDYVESLNKETFTEKAGVNSVILDSTDNLKGVAQNIGFSVSLYSGQMCTAPQNVFISKDGINTADGKVSFDEVVSAIKNSVDGLVNHPKMGAGTLGGIQNENTLKRVKDGGNFGGEIVLDTKPIANAEFENARTASPKVIVMDADNVEQFSQECFGPILFIIKTDSTDHSIELAAKLASEKGAITCLAFSTDNDVKKQITDAMNAVFTPVSLNLSGAAFVNQHAAFSDFHVTGGNPAGNASFTNPEYINRRFVWVGNRWM